MGFSFKGIHSKSFGIGVRTIKNEILPKAKEITVTSDFTDGEIDFSEYSGRMKYETRIFEKEIFIKGKNAEDYKEKIRNVVKWLQGGYNELILDENPDIIWQAKLNNQIEIEPIFFRSGKATVYFKAYPIGKGKEKTVLDLTSGKNTFINNGWYCKPLLIVNGDFSNLKVSLNGEQIRYSKSVSGELEIDFEKMTVEENASDKTAKSYGNFGEIKDGENEVIISATGEYNAVLSYYQTYLW